MFAVEMRRAVGLQEVNGMLACYLRQKDSDSAKFEVLAAVLVIVRVVWDDRPCRNLGRA
jgi:hypothetical protein